MTHSPLASRVLVKYYWQTVLVYNIQFWKKKKQPSQPPPPNPTFCPKWEIGVNVGLGEGWVGSFPASHTVSFQQRACTCSRCFGMTLIIIHSGSNFIQCPFWTLYLLSWSLHQYKNIIHCTSLSRTLSKVILVASLCGDFITCTGVMETWYDHLCHYK